MKKTNNSNEQQSWKDRFFQKIFRGVTTFSLIPVIAHIIAPEQYWAYIHKTGFFHPRLRKEKPILPILPDSESKYFRIRIILSVSVFLIYYFIVFSTVKFLKANYSDMIYFRDPFLPPYSMYPDTHIINEIMVVLVPIGIWFISFLITLVHYLKEKGKSEMGKSIWDGKNQNTALTIWRIFLFFVLLIFLLIIGLMMIALVNGYRSWLVIN